MLKRLKAQVSQVANELPGVLSASSPSGSTRSAEGSFMMPEPNEDGEIEGFLCPICMGTFSTPDELSGHFETNHAVADSPTSMDNPNFQRPEPTATTSFPSKDKEIEELKHQLTDEKVFSNRLKEELDRIQSVVAQATDVPDGEVPYLMQQIQVLEAGKSMVTQRMLETEKEASQLKRSLDNLTQERADIMKKLKQQSNQVRELTDENENIKVEKDAITRELHNYKSQITTLEKENDDLIKTLDQRPSEDDVNVLRTELVNAQKLMDEIAQQKDVEIAEHLNSIRHLNMEREHENCLLVNLKQQLESNGQTSDEASSTIASLNTEITELKLNLEKSQQEMTSLSKENGEKSSQTADLEKKLSETSVKLSDSLARIGELDELLEKSKKEYEDAQELNEKKAQQLEKLNKMLEESSSNQKQQETTVQGFEEKTQTLSDQIRNLEQANKTLSNDLSTLTNKFEQEKATVVEKTTLLKEKEDLLHKKCECLEKSNGKVEKLSSELSEVTDVCSSLRKQIESSEARAKELLQKVTDGEGGAQMAIAQLTEEKARLSEEIVLLTTTLKETKDELFAKLEESEKSARDAANVHREKLQSVETTTGNLKKTIEELEDEISRKTERFVDLEKERENDQHKSMERMTKMKELLAQKETVFKQLQSENEKLNQSIENNEKSLKEKEKHIDENRLRLEEAVKRLEEAEAKARQLNADLESSGLQLSKSSETETELRQQLDQSVKSNDKLKHEVAEFVEQIKLKEDELSALQKELKEKESHWNSKKEEFMEQIEKNQETNEELLTSITELKTTLEAEKADKKTKEVKLTNLEENHSENLIRIEELEVSTKEKEDSIISLQKTVSELEEEKRSIQDSFDQNKEKTIKLESTFEDLKVRVSNLSEQLTTSQTSQEDLKNEFSSKQAAWDEEKKTLEQEISQKDEDLFKLSQAMARLENQVAEKEKENGFLTERLGEFEGQVTQHKSLLDQMKDEHSQMSEEWKSLEEQFKNDVATAEDRESGLRKELESIQMELGQKIDCIKKLEAKCAQFEQLSKDVVSEKDEVIAGLKSENDNLATSKHEMEEAFLAKETDLQGQIENQKRTIQSIQSEFDHVSSLHTDSQKAMEEMTMANMELQKQIKSWEDEKNALIERCLKTESDLDFERERSMENKRRFDDSLSAMHELGRANQSLQIDISKHTSRKWLDDSAAVNCTDCGKGFTMTVRKHHCRVCGLIFCAQCSDKTVSVASSKNPVRVCNHCHTEVLNR